MIPFLGCSTLQGAGVSSLGYLLGCNRKADIRSSWAGKGSRGGCRTGAVNVFCSPPISGLESHRSLLLEQEPMQPNSVSRMQSC